MQAYLPIFSITIFTAAADVIEAITNSGIKYDEEGVLKSYMKWELIQRR